MAAVWLCRLQGGPNRVNHTAVIVGRYMVVIGGFYTGLLFHNMDPVDVIIFSFNTYTWRKLHTKNNAVELKTPFMRYGHTSVAYKNEIYLWGGRNDIRACNKLYKLNLEKSEWCQIDATGEVPLPRDGHSACLIGSKMYIFGGYLDQPQNVFATGLYCLDLETFRWHSVSFAGQQPSCRDFHSAVAIGKKMYVFGGRGSNTPQFNSNHFTYPTALHVWDETTGSWTERPRRSDGPVGRRSLSLFVHGKYIYSFGGFNAIEQQHFNDLYRYSPDDDVWTKIETLGMPPTPRRRQSCVVMEDRVYIYGGTSPENSDHFMEDDENNLRDHNDLYVLDLAPTLKSLSMKTIVEYRLNYSTLPTNLVFEVSRIDCHSERKKLTNGEEDGPMPRRRRRR